MSIELTKKQKDILDGVIDAIIHYYHVPITLGGYAGTGKTTLIAEIARTVKKENIAHRIAFCAFTGKAADVLRRKLKGLLQKKDTCSTIHKLMYIPEYGWDPKRKVKIIIGWERKDRLDCDLIIIDEASMVDKNIMQDLRSYKKPILAVGDSGQLPPVGSKSNLVENPQFMLTDIMRQAADSPIISASQYIRDYGCIPMGQFKGSNNVVKLRLRNPVTTQFLNSVDYRDDGVIMLCGNNATRVLQNRRVRKLLDYTEIEPYPGERVINLNNDYDLGIFNGQLGNISWFARGPRDTLALTVDFEGNDELIEVGALQKSFDRVNHDEIFEMIQGSVGQSILGSTKFSSFAIMDFGYCITVHKSQGSEWDKVILFEEGRCNWISDPEGYTKWLYTAVTRAKESVVIITDEE